MKRLLLIIVAGGLALAWTPQVAPQGRPPLHPTQPGEEDRPLPNGKSRQEEILKDDHQKDLNEATQLLELAEQLKAELEKDDRHVLSLASVKKTEEIEKLAKRIHARLVH